MQTKLFSEMFRQEKTYWWHVAKRQLVMEFITKYRKFGEQVLDIGCGTGAMMEDLKTVFSDVSGLDGSKDAIDFCHKRGIKSAQLFDFEKKLQIQDNRFDVVTCLDVLEHVEGDDAFLKELNRITKPGGLVVINVPAFGFLWSYWDVMLGHKRRYTKEKLSSDLEKANFKIIRCSYVFSFLLPTAILFRIIKNILKIQDKSDFVDVPKIVNKTLLMVCYIERFILKFIDLPFGLSVIVVVTK